MKSTRVAPLDSRSVKSLTERFSRLVSSGSRRKELEKTLFHLKSERLRNTANAKVFVEHGGLQASVALSRRLRPADKSDAKLLALLWGTMANVCSLDRQARSKIAELGTPEICKLLSESSCSDVVNTVSRTVGNIASGGSASIFLQGKTLAIVRDLTRILQTCQDSCCLQSVIRTVKMLGKDHEVREELRMCESLLAVVSCLRREEKPVKEAALDTLESFFVSSEPEFLQMLWLPSGNEGLSLVSAHACDIGLHGTSCQMQAVNVLIECSKHYDGKAALSRAGGIEALVRFLSLTDKSEVIHDEVVNALCMCCRDVHGRQKLRDSGGLQFLITMLRDCSHAILHDDILSALVCYYFDENTLRFMVRMFSLMRSLVFHLERMARKETEFSFNVLQDLDSYRPADNVPIVDVSTPNSFALEMAEIGSDIGVAECPDMDDTQCSGVSSQSHHHSFKLDSGKLSSSPVSRSASSLSCSSGHPWSSGESSRSLSSEPQPLKTLISVTTNSPIDSKMKVDAIDVLGLDPSRLMPSSPKPTLNRSCLLDSGISPSFSPEFSSISSSQTNASPHCWSSSSVSSGESEDEQEVEDQENKILSSLPHRAGISMGPTTPLSLPRSIVTVDLESSTPMPTNFIDSLLSSPNYYENRQSNRQEIANPFCDGNSTTGTKVLFLLSRISHLRDCQPVLASPEVLPAILDYFYANDPPDIHCFKVMSRVFSNPHCFQDCVLNLTPSRVFGHLSCTPDHRTTSDLATKPETLTAFSSTSNLGAQSPSAWSPSGFLPSPVATDAYGHPLVPPIEDLSRQLFEKLARVAESPYGQGVIAHALLRGDLKHVQASSLAMTLLYRSHSVCQKMLLGYGGLRNLNLLAQGINVDREMVTDASSETSQDVTETSANGADFEAVHLQPMAISALLFLACHCSRQVPPRKRSLSLTSEDVPETSPPRKQARRNSPSLQSWTSTGGIHLAVAHHPVVAAALSPSPSLQVCRYIDSDHCPFDLILCVDGGRHPFPVHRTVMMESSEVFSVMLGGRYQESSQDKVQIQQVPMAAFEALLHHVYGCAQNCRGGDHAVPLSGSRRCSCLKHRQLVADTSGESSQTPAEEPPDPVDELVRAIASPLSPPEQGAVLETLQTLICADQFFVPALVHQCEQRLSRHITSDNLMPMFLFSQIHHSHFLARRCIWCLVSLPQSSKQVEVFKELLLSPEKESFLEMIQSYFLHTH